MLANHLWGRTMCAFDKRITAVVFIVDISMIENTCIYACFNKYQQWYGKQAQLEEKKIIISTIVYSGMVLKIFFFFNL